MREGAEPTPGTASTAHLGALARVVNLRGYVETLLEPVPGVRADLHPGPGRRVGEPAHDVQVLALLQVIRGERSDTSRGNPSPKACNASVYPETRQLRAMKT